MQTSGADRGHQHEVSEKRLAPGTFPCRLDMEIPACGAKRWVVQDGTPATPWQFVNLRARPARRTPRSALDGLVTCGNCGQPMTLDDTQGDREASYACQSRCPTPRLHARKAGTQLVRTVLKVVLTEENTSRVLAVANYPRRYDASREHRLTREEVQDGARGKRGTPCPHGRQDPGEQRTAGQVHRRDTDPRRTSGRPQLHPAAGGQSPCGHASAGNRPAGGYTNKRKTCTKNGEFKSIFVQRPAARLDSRLDAPVTT